MVNESQNRAARADGRLPLMLRDAHRRRGARVRLWRPQARVNHGDKIAVTRGFTHAD